MKIRKTKKENVNIAECSIFQLFQIGTEQDQYRVETMTVNILKSSRIVRLLTFVSTIKPSVKSLNHEHLRVGSLGGLDKTKLGITQDQNGFSTIILMF